MIGLAGYLQEVDQLLIEGGGADVNAQTKEGHTALKLALRDHLMEIEEILKKAGTKK